METYKCERKSLNYQGILSLKDALTIQNKKEKFTLHVVDDYIQTEMIRKQILKRYQKLLQMLRFYFETGDDTGVVYQEALNDMERFRRLMANKYRAYLKEEEEKQMSMELSILEKRAHNKLILLEHTRKEIREEENRRSR